jgi:hypothetical protein
MHFPLSSVVKTEPRPDTLLKKELELELIQTQMTQKPMLRAEVYARALRASQNRKEDSV